ncbi:MAG: hypothetical protein WA635_07600 [Gallionella sp.]
MSDKTKKNIWWPDVSTPAAALSARIYGVWAAAVTSILTALLASWSLGSGKAAYGLVDTWSFVDVAIFTAIAIGIYKKSRFAAVAGLAIFVAEKLYQLAITPTAINTTSTIVAIIFAMCYVAAIRGTYALRRLESGGIMDDKTAITEAPSLPDFELHPRVKFLLKWAWSILAFGLIFDAFSTQLIYDVPRLEGARIINRAAFALGGLLGDIPVIVIVGIIIAAVARFGFSRTISLRIFVVSLALASIINALIILPILRALYG